MTTRDGAGGTTEQTLLAKVVVPLDALKLLTEVVASVAMMHRTTQEEQTKRAHIEAQVLVKIEAVSSMREVLIDYLARSFDERRGLFDELFSRLGEAAEVRDVKMAASILGGIVEIARSNPLGDLAELSTIADLLGKDGAEWKI
ncbi:hypothetical protein [Polyangium sorediatum]|uniref:Uncharacterized protein n=1 Tax=Polyangium sorediatum TaxID=889274 RepID=A0ABT6NY66_9BACT|nr:hypothetical protein [Polyangium sorediatum]MDI1433253.1 hypothetical protein [Polyangium sorediatum]